MKCQILFSRKIKENALFANCPFGGLQTKIIYDKFWCRINKNIWVFPLSGSVTLCMLGKNFSRQHFEIFSLFSQVFDTNSHT